MSSEDDHFHCNNCYFSYCDYSNCPIETCNFCFVALHGCKLSEHQEEICRKVVVPCTNAQNGCEKRLQRERINAHLLKCLASVVVCTREWSRKSVNHKSKLFLKECGKKGIPITNKSSTSADLAFALRDQEKIVESYKMPRKSRNRRRDRIHPFHPLLPLREIADEYKETNVSGDSSEEERELEIKKLKGSRRVFGNCRMCQIDPTAQHLHTLGNVTGLDEPVPLVLKKFEERGDDFCERNGLQIKFNAEYYNECSSKNRQLTGIRFQNSAYTFRCLHVVKRAEYANHQISQHSYIIENLSNLIFRCPNFLQGCEFHCSRLENPANVIYSKELDSFCFRPKIEESEDENPKMVSKLEEMPDWVFQTRAEIILERCVAKFSLFVSRNATLIVAGQKCKEVGSGSNL
ncbi:unnamed protein product [Caenorhabditis auriculariae]|uniref:TRAF-type domain-containing protein n=1 Tax=Caenorhabditis auriculariae TaxID=2777116 RepID=A0A8S1H0P2_9PELO|nr:unnamed protein product [Caenorhabditis auriculariae]